jgi:protein-S-isoprenylcysteine O-methyltransferase
MNSLAALLGLLYFLSEVGVAITKHGRRAGAERKDRGSLRLLWISIAIGIYGAVTLSNARAGGAFTVTPAWTAAAVVVFACGIAFRWWAILTLGRMFTVDVSILADHELVVRGPFEIVRHPSYTGALLAFLGLGIAFGSAGSIAAVFVPFFCALLYRIHVEESALRSQFGASYDAYAARTKRLVPGVF